MNDAFWSGFFSACLFIGALVMLRVLLGTYGESRYREGWNDHALRAVRGEGPLASQADPEAVGYIEKGLRLPWTKRRTVHREDAE